jgi:FlaA1/EpsC-like NDP-sugar epimerase
MQIKDKILLITGGTGSFGNAVLSQFLHTDHFKEIRILSRDEKKQDDLRKKVNNNKVKFYLGDVRDVHSIDSAIKGVDYIFHAAALKQVPSCEFFPMEAVKTNIIGTDNVLTIAEKYEVLAKALNSLYDSNSEIKIIGTRHGEKTFETLVNREDMVKAEDCGNYFRIPADNRDLNYEQYFSEGDIKMTELEEYHSNNTEIFDVEAMKQLLLKLPLIRKDIYGEEINKYFDL